MMIEYASMKRVSALLLLKPRAVFFAFMIMGTTSNAIFGQPPLGSAREIPSTQSVDIRVRLFNSNNGKPMSGQTIWIYLGWDHAAHTPEQRTDENGATVFHLQPPVPKWINAVTGSQTIWHCTDIEKNTFATSDVLEHGMVALNKCDLKGKRTGKISAKPGEVILFARPLRFWERMLRIYDFTECFLLTQFW